MNTKFIRIAEKLKNVFFAFFKILLKNLFLSLLIIVLPIIAFSQDNSDCLGCHSDATLKATHGKKSYSVFVNEKNLLKSVHSKEKCISCHVDLKDTDFPHKENPNKAKCGSCHKDEQGLYNECLHGKAYAKGDPLAPTCQTCHGSHSIVPNKEKPSPVYPLNIPKLCGRCHKEGTPVQMQRNIPESHILQNYTESIHGEGLIKKGLVVSATCASCHSPHRILPHTDPRSTIARQNIAKTCTKCHNAIEEVHKKIINGQLWEKEAKVLPACVDCHQPHKIRQVFYEENVANASCIKCHDQQHLKSAVTGKSMYVNTLDIQESKHAKIACAQCHVDINPSHARPCDVTTKKVDCSSCHSEVGNDYQKSFHGILYSKGNTDAPYCVDCHGTHKILGKTDHNSPIFSMNIPSLCSRCHQEGKPANRMYKGSEHQIIKNYSESIHGQGLLKSGLTVTATCADCHTAHKGLPHSNPESSISPQNIAKTCGNCHYGIQSTFEKSIHSPLVSNSKEKLPVCNDCHTAHTIKRTDEKGFRTEILTTCGKCHKQIAEAYFDTYHGKVSRLGLSKAAKCSDCHGSHNIMPVENPNSTLSRYNIVSTCKKCHQNANRGFVKYFTHATHHDPRKYPLLFWTFWGMTILLLVTFFLSFAHTIMWLPRSIQMRKQIKALSATHVEHEGDKKFTRFKPLNRFLHVIMIISFITLAITGLCIKFSYTPLAGFIVNLLGGVESAGYVHRTGATFLFLIFITHIIDLIMMKRTEFKSWKSMLFGPNTMLPTKKDLSDLTGSIKWYFGKGPRPQFGRWTYWEKFDYFAVFWGIFVIGSTGLTLWFPELFTNIIPGWFLNVATIIHSDEALLAAGFIFTVHFFNTHFRPEKFPMDTVIFSGQLSVEELKFDRPYEYDQLAAAGELEKNLAQPFSPNIMKLLRIFGFAALTLGLCVVIWIIYAMVIAY